MIPSRKLPVFERWFSGHAEARLRRGFSRVHVHGLGAARRATSEGPVVVVANHVAFWDPLVVLWLSARVLGVDGYALMDAANLRRLPFFAAVGAFGVDLDEPRDGARAMRYAARLLRGPGHVVWIFPQGGERPEAEPLAFRRGAAEIARVARASVLPLGLRYVHRGAERPEAFVSFGGPLGPGPRDVDAARRAHEEAVGAELARIGRHLLEADAEPFEVALTAPVPRLGALAEAMLAWAFRRRLSEGGELR